jgi:hypothetical protein
MVYPRKLSTHTWNMRTYHDIFILEFFNIWKKHFQLGFTCTHVQTGLFQEHNDVAAKYEPVTLMGTA